MQDAWANPFHAEECPKRGHSSRLFMDGFGLLQKNLLFAICARQFVRGLHQMKGA